MDNTRIHIAGVFDLFWSNHIYLLKTIPYSPQTNAVELTFSLAKSFINALVGSDRLFAGMLTEIFQAQVQNEYLRREMELRRRFPVIVDDGEVEIGNFAVDNVNVRRLTEEIVRLDQWRDDEMQRAVHYPETVSPHTMELTEEVFHAIIHRAFREVTPLNTLHFLGHTIKVAHSCIRGYPLSMSRYFYDFYDFEDDDILRLYSRFADEI